jgi:hypothetical protein
LKERQISPGKLESSQEKCQVIGYFNQMRISGRFVNENGGKMETRKIKVAMSSD